MASSAVRKQVYLLSLLQKKEELIYAIVILLRIYLVQDEAISGN